MKQGHAEGKYRRRQKGPIERSVRRPFKKHAATKVRRKVEPNAKSRDGKGEDQHRRRRGNYGTSNVCSGADDGGNSEGDRRRFGFTVAPRLCRNADDTEHRTPHLQRREFVGVGTRLLNAPNAYKPEDCKCSGEDRGDGREMEHCGTREWGGCRGMRRYSGAAVNHVTIE